jgi:hypothetical protein
VETRKSMAKKNGWIISEWAECAKNERWIGLETHRDNKHRI